MPSIISFLWLLLGSPMWFAVRLVRVSERCSRSSCIGCRWANSGLCIFFLPMYISRRQSFSSSLESSPASVFPFLHFHLPWAMQNCELQHCKTSLLAAVYTFCFLSSNQSAIIGTCSENGPGFRGMCILRPRWRLSYFGCCFVVCPLAHIAW